jgi:uncharacterized membrane protein
LPNNLICKIKMNFSEIGRKRYFIPICIVFLFAINVLLKFYKIGWSSLWIDEAYSISEAQKSISEIIFDCANVDNPPVYFVLLHYWCQLFGFSEAGTRSMSAFFSIITALLVFYYLWKHNNLFSALTGSLLYTFSNAFLFYSQETRNYALTGLLTILSIIFYTDIFFSKAKIKTAALAIANILLLFTHYIGGFLILAEGFTAIFFIRKNRGFLGRFIVSCIVSALAFIPWMSNALSHVPEEGKFWLHKPTFYNFKGLFIDFAGNKITLILMFAIIGYGIFNFITTKSERNTKEYFQLLLFLSWSIGVVVLLYFIAFFRPVFLTRYLLFCAIGFYILVTYSLSLLKISDWVKATIVIVLIGTMLFSLRLHPTKEEGWREAVNKVKSLQNKDDIVIVSVFYMNNAFSYYYDRSIFKDYNNIETRLNKERIFSVSIADEQWLSKLPSSKRIILVQSHQIDDDPDNTVINTIRRHANESSEFTFEKVKVFVFEKASS